MKAKSALWLGVAVCAYAIIDAHTWMAVPVLFPIGATAIFIALCHIDPA